MKKRHLCAAAVGLGLLAGCVAPAAPAGDGGKKIQIVNGLAQADIERARSGEVKLPNPAKAGLVYALPMGGKDKQAFFGKLQKTADGIPGLRISGVLPADLLEPPGGPLAFRHLAASRQDDLLLYFLYGEEPEAEAGILGYLNLLILPAFVVPTRVVTVTSEVQVYLMDVGTGRLLLEWREQASEARWTTLAGVQGRVVELRGRLLSALLDKSLAALAEQTPGILEKNRAGN